MKFKIRLFLFFFALSVGFNHLLFSQTDKSLDSLWNLHRHEKIDTAKIKLLLTISDYLKQKNTDSAIVILQIALKKSNALNLPKFTTKSLNLLGACYTYKGMFDSSFYYFNKRLKIEKKLKNKAGISDCYYNIAYLYNLKGFHKNALSYLYKTLKIKQQLNDQQKVASCFFSIGNAYFMQNEYSKAIDYYYKSLAINIRYDNKKDISIIYTNLGSIYITQKKYDQALKLNLKALKTFVFLNRTQDIALTYCNIGNILQYKGKLNEALEYYNKSLTLYQNIQNKNGISTVYILLSDLFREKKQYRQAIQFAQKGLEIAKNIGLITQQKEAYEELSSNFDSIGDFDNAYQYHKLFKSINDSIYNVESSKQIKQMAAEYENEQRIKEIEFLNKKNELNNDRAKKNKIILSFAVFVILLLLIFTFILKNRLKINRKNKQIIEKQNIELIFYSQQLVNNQSELEKLVDERTENYLNEKKNAEESERKYRLIAENTSDGILVLNSDTEIEYLSISYKKMHGYNLEEEVTGNAEKIYSLIHPDDRTVLFATILKAQEEKKNELIYSYRVKHEKGHYFWREYHAKFNYDSNGNHINTYVICRDITKRKKNEEELIKAKEKAEESDNLKIAFLNNMSHEVRTPLNAIIGFSEIIANLSKGSAELMDYSKIITKNSNKLTEIITDVIEISQLQANQIVIQNSYFDFLNLVTDIKNEFEPIVAQKKLQFSLTVSPHSKTYPVHADRNKIYKIVKHLISNAIKFTHKGEILINFNLLNGKIVIKILDTGIGIAKEKQAVILEPFSQVEIGLSRNFGGNGVGLAIVKGLVGLLNGKIELNSNINKGATFFVTLPIPRASDAITSNDMDNNSKTKTVTILIAQDHYILYEGYKRELQKLYPTILHAANGQEAVDLCRTNEQISLVLMNIDMPVMDGFTATKLIKAFRPELPIIAHTAFSFKDIIEKMIECGFDDYLGISVSRETFFKTIDKHLNR